MSDSDNCVLIAMAPFPPFVIRISFTLFMLTKKNKSGKRKIT
ncbi:hypothetical protein QY96_03333 [Bacillus thermotolerans]|nr:hypothetical protein QY96_03333 [Bacillus thermotolerans]